MIPDVSELGVGVAAIVALASAAVWLVKAWGHILDNQQKRLENVKLTHELRMAGVEEHGDQPEAARRTRRAQRWALFALATGVVAYWFITDPPLTTRNMIIVLLAVALYPMIFVMGVGEAVLRFESSFWWVNIELLRVRAGAPAQRNEPPTQPEKPARQVER